VKQRLGAGLQALGKRVQDVGRLVHPALLAARAGVDVPERRPRTQRAVAADELGLVETAIAQVAQDDRPGLGALAVAVLDREQLLDAVLADADDDQQAQLVVLAEAHLDMHAVDEQVRVARELQAALLERGVVSLPGLGETLDRARRQPGRVVTEQILERRREVAGRQGRAGTARAAPR
jgi:hypothetical protein